MGREIEVDKELSFRIYLFFKIRRIDNELKNVSVFSVVTLNEFIGLPLGTLGHFLKLRRLLNNDKLYQVEAFLKKYFGFDSNRVLTAEEMELMESLDIFDN